MVTKIIKLNKWCNKRTKRAKENRANVKTEQTWATEKLAENTQQSSINVGRHPDESHLRLLGHNNDLSWLGAEHGPHNHKSHLLTMRYSVPPQDSASIKSSYHQPLGKRCWSVNNSNLSKPWETRSLLASRFLTWPPASASLNDALWPGS